MEREHITPQGVSVFHDKNESIHSFCLVLVMCGQDHCLRQRKRMEFLIFLNILYLKIFLCHGRESVSDLRSVWT
mgnify:CR=1 FL=1